MNEQLIVKNFGPIKNATVDFKKVTVFIGPTGGGKSTLAKLAAIFKSHNFLGEYSKGRLKHFDKYLINNFLNNLSSFTWVFGNDKLEIDERMAFNSPTVINDTVNKIASKSIPYEKDKLKYNAILRELLELTLKTKDDGDLDANQRLTNAIEKHLKQNNGVFQQVMSSITEVVEESKKHEPIYIPTERVFIPAIEYSWAGLIRDDIGLSRVILEFANLFNANKNKVKELYIPFLNVKYLHQDGNDYIKIPHTKNLFRLYEAASGIQSVIPLLVCLEYISRQNEHKQSFIIEEPELNLYPTAQQGLLNWLVEKCAAGENDLTITTHSPYILSHINLLLYAYQVAEKHPDRAGDVAKVVPRESWINPKEFACYQVENGGVESLVNEDLGLIDDNGLDNLSGDAADAFDNLIRLSKSLTLK